MRSTVIARQVREKPTANQFHHQIRDPRIPNRRVVFSGLLFALVLISGCARNNAVRCKAISESLELLEAHGDNSGALLKAQEGLDTCKGVGNPRSYWNFYLSKAERLNRLGRYSDALSALQQEPPGGNKFAYVRVTRLIEQSWAAYSISEYPKAESLLNDAENQVGETGSLAPFFRSRIAVRKAYLFRDERKFDEATQAMERVNVEDGGIDKQDYLLAYGWILLQTARFEEAAQKFEEALPGVKASGDPLKLGQFFNNLGDAYYHLGDLSRAFSFSAQAEPLLAHADDRAGLRICLNREGLIFLDNGDYPKASAYIERSLRLATDLGGPKSQAEDLSNLASIAIANKDWKKAEGYNERALQMKEKLKDHEAELYSLLNQARIYEGQDQFAGALDTLQRVCDQPYVNPVLRLDAEEEYIVVYRRLHEEANARRHYQSALALFDQVRGSLRKDEVKLSWSSTRNTLHQEWVRFLVEMNHIGEALEAAESTRVRLMLERMGKNPGLSTNGIAEYQHLAQAQDAVLVSYWLAPEVSYVWVVKPGKTDFVRLPPESEITALVASYRGFVEDNGDPRHTDNIVGDRLRQAILDPVLPFLQGAQRIILVLDGSLHALNFETLRVNGRYWIEDVSLTIAPSLNLLGGKPPARRIQSPTLFAIGDAVPSAGFPRLADASREIDAVSALFPVNTVLRDKLATPAAYLEDSAPHTFIHFAAHASASSEQPLESAVILSPGAGDGRLTARDLLKKPIHAELVTISACRSAGVRSYRGEGLVGFAWVFLQTGAHGVIAGLWDASDDATARIMTGLYTRIAHGMSPPAALREAKLELIHSNTHFDHPYYWAPFQYYVGPMR